MAPVSLPFRLMRLAPPRIILSAMILAPTLLALILTPAAASQGELRVLTYNVAGLPAGLSHGNPAVNSPLISPRLNSYDLVFLQEDFRYHKELMSEVELPHRVAPRKRGLIGFGDGLSLVAELPLSNARRVAWKSCNGIFEAKSDCLTPKGFTLAELELAPGVFVDVYDLHADAGKSRHDSAARAKQVAQFVAFVRSRPADRAVIVGGDTNMRLDDEANFQALLAGAGLTDSCRQLMCPEQGRIDRVLYRSGGRVRLEAVGWTVPSEEFRDAESKPLSDHEPVAARLAWTVAP